MTLPKLQTGLLRPLLLVRMSSDRRVRMLCTLCLEHQSQSVRYQVIDYFIIKELLIPLLERAEVGIDWPRRVGATDTSGPSRYYPGLSHHRFYSADRIC